LPACLFCQVIKAEVPAAVVFEDELTFAFLDHRPLFPGHCLLVPKQHFETLADLPAELIAPLFSNAQLLVRAVEEVMEAEGTFVAMNNRVSQSVPHFHIHIVPRRKKDGLKGFFWPRQKYANELEMTNVQRMIKKRITALQELRAQSEKG
jgi:histidine triad (HIT) family protein